VKFILTPALIRSSYVFLRQHGPLSLVAMPPTTEFKAIRTSKVRGYSQYRDDGEPCVIEISRNLIEDAGEAFAIIAHEMLHLAQDVALKDAGEDHGPWFQARGQDLCAYFGWTPDQFGLCG
jgi:hypothetical protein